MSLDAKRWEIAQALSTVGGVQGHANRPVPPAEGDAWPILGPLDRDAGTAFLATWLVRVLVPQDEVAASRWFDSHWPALFDALSRVMYVQRAVPTIVTAQGQDLYVYEISGIAEE